MGKKRSRKRRKAKNVIGGAWLANLMIWGGVVLMLTGGVVAYPTLQAALIPPDPQGLEFSVTLAPAAAGATSQPSAEEPAEVVADLLEVTIQPSATPLPSPTPDLAAQDATLTASEVVAEQTATPEPTAVPPTATATPTPSATPTATPTPTPDPADLVPNRLEIPAIKLDAPVLVVGWETKEVNGEVISTWIVPDEYAAGWHMTSALPGEPGNTVLNGHHNIFGEVFRYLVDLQPGDEVILHTNQGPRYYAVTERHILKEKYASPDIRVQNAQFIQRTEDERLTMVTCWPYTNNTHRLIVVALPSEPTPTPTSGAE